ncbi:MAG TPA: class I SAM-dependent methyltransferase [Chitinophagaceae bacterium]|nr:class I SAM-dependent methyltransferase [Chitinophagaceae bacterium]
MLKKFIASQFKKPTGLFGIFSSNIMIRGNKNKYDKLIKDLDIQPNDKLLEIGYGPGVGINIIAGKCDTCTIHGIDFSPLMYKRAVRYNRSYIDKGTMVLQYGDFLKISTPDNDYDKIFCLNVVYFWNELKEPFMKVLSLLKKGGVFHIFMADKSMLKKTPDSVFNKYSIEQVTGVLTSAGFTEVENYFDKGYYIKAKK